MASDFMSSVWTNMTALEEDLLSSSTLVSLLKELERSAHENEVYFSGSKTDKLADEIAVNFGQIRHQINDGVLPLVKQLYSVAHRYDPCPGIKANGIRSWLAAVKKLGAFLLQLSNYFAYKRNSMFFRRSANAYKLKIHAEYFCGTRKCLEILLRLTTTGSGTSLICDSSVDPSIGVDDVISVISQIRQVDVTAFCARTQCFHLGDSAQSVAQAILLAYATFSAAYGQVESSPQQTSPSVRRVGFFSLFSNSDALGQQVIWALANFDLAFVKRFWQLGDNRFLLAGADFLIPALGVIHSINLHSIPVQVRSQSGGELTVDAPSDSPIRTRLLSHTFRKGQEYWQDITPPASRPPASDCIIFQVHGGGFICQSARAQEVYLRQFAQVTKAPFFCVDYSLLPEHPFPRALDEVFYSFCWMLKNFAKLGTSGKRIVCVGDSAGGCLLLAMCIRLIEVDIRLPDAMLLACPYACSTLAPSASRLLALADPIVPIPLLVRCACGYANLTEVEARLVLGIGKISPSQDSRTEPSNKLLDDGFQQRCPETPLPSGFDDSRNTGVNAVSRLRRAKSLDFQRPAAGLATSKSFSSGLNELGPNIQRGDSRRADSDSTGLLDSNFQQTQLSEAERLTLTDLLALPVFSNPLFSPISAPDTILSKFPALHIVGSTSDPLLDDSVTLCRRLRQLGNRCDFTIVEGVPHAFLSLHLLSRACSEATRKVGLILKQLADASDS